MGMAAAGTVPLAWASPCGDQCSGELHNRGYSALGSSDVEFNQSLLNERERDKQNENPNVKKSRK